MRVVCDIETNGLDNPDKIWLVCLKDIDTDEHHIYKNLTTDVQEKERFLEDAKKVTYWIGHGILHFDFPVLSTLIDFPIPENFPGTCDTLVVSKLLDYSRVAHSLEQYGIEMGHPKGSITDFSKYDPAMEAYCIRDTDITHKVYLKYSKHILHKDYKSSLCLEHQFQIIVNTLHNNGFSFNKDKAIGLLGRVELELSGLDREILKQFPPKLKLIREITPKVTQHGTLSKSDFRFVKDGDLSDYNGGPFCRCEWVDFNPSSHRQIVAVLSNSGWSPVDKTQTHIETERELNRLKYGRREKTELDIATQDAMIKKLEELRVTGWKVNENNLNTLPPSAPSPARTLAKRILLESRRRTLTEWLGLVGADSRIHGTFYSIGAWTHRMAHQHPNTANIPTDAKLYGGEMRALWRAPKNRLLIGVDAEGIQLRIFAHYINDPDFTNSLVNGKKEDKSDPHSLNQSILQCKSRNIAKRFIFAYLLGAGVGKLAQILELPEDEAREALGRLLERYKGLQVLRETIIPADAKRGYFRGLDGRLVRIPGDTPGERKHLCMSGYLQNGEAVVMKSACVKWADKLKDYNALLVNFVHDEWQTECPNNMETALQIAKLQADSLREVGEELKLLCPLAGSYWNEDAKDYTIGTNWKVTH